MTDQKVKALKKLRSSLLDDAQDSIFCASEERRDQLTMITDYLKSISCSLYAIAAQYEIEDVKEETDERAL